MTETIYQQTKKLTKKSKEDKTNQSMLIKLSLTRQHQNILEYVTKVTDDYSLIHLIYININCNLKMCLKVPIKSRVECRFNNKTELAEILGLIEYSECHVKFGEDTQSI